MPGFVRSPPPPLLIIAHFYFRGRFPQTRINRCSSLNEKSLTRSGFLCCQEEVHESFPVHRVQQRTLGHEGIRERVG
jgi:hypothetical protein